MFDYFLVWVEFSIYEGGVLGSVVIFVDVSDDIYFVSY